MGKYGIIKVSDGLYADTDRVIKSVVADILGSINGEVCIRLDDLKGHNYSCVTVRDGNIYKETWDEDYHSNICDEEEFFVSDKPEDIENIRGRSEGHEHLRQGDKIIANIYLRFTVYCTI